MTADQCRAIIDERNRARAAHAATTDGNSTIAGPPTTIQVNTGTWPAPTPAPPQEAPLIPQPGTLFRNMLSQATQRSTNAGQQARGDGETVTINGTQYRRANVTYRVSQRESTIEMTGTLVDGGANGGVFGEDDVLILEYDEGQTVDLTGVGNIEHNNLRLALGASIVETVNDGKIILLMAQYADLGRGKTIHSKGQIQNFGHIVKDTSRLAGGQ